jgi:hypothetical protein
MPMRRGKAYQMKGDRKRAEADFGTANALRHQGSTKP